MLHIQPPIPNLRTCHFPSSSFSSLRFSLPTSSFSFPSRARFTRVVTAAVTSPEMEALDAKVLKQGIAELYDESSGVWEDIWGDHMHHGFYDPDVQVSASLSNHRAAQIRMIEEALRFAGVSEDPTKCPKNVVDVGCGIGGSSRYIAKKFGAKCQGITLSPVQAQRANALAAAEGLADKVSFQVGDALEQPFPDGQFDLVWSMESGEHMPDKKKFVSELARVAASGATIIIVTWCHRNLSPSEESLQTWEKEHLKKICDAYYLPEWCSASDYVKLLEGLSLEDIKTACQVFKEMGDINEVSWCSLLFAYTNSGRFSEASEIFNLMPRKFEIAWNTMIAGLGRYGEIELCLDMFREMRESLLEPDQWTYSALISACTESLEFLSGCMLHGLVIRSGWSSAMEAKNSILSLYAKFGSLNDALKVVESTGRLTQVSWNAIIDAYMKVGYVNEAYLMFQSLPEKNIVSWTSMITGYARNGYGEEALRFFVAMASNCFLPDDFTFGAVLHACSSLAVLGHGRMVHGCAIRNGFSTYLYVGNGLVNMYAKCGDLDGSILAFHDICAKDLVSFNALLFAFGLHGKASEALQLYEDMMTCGTKPDKMTFIGLLMTCSHSGLIEEGRLFFNSMKSVHGLSYEVDHVACMVDMLGRGGYLAEAKELVKKYSKTSDVEASSCEALLGACSAHGEVEMGTYLGKTLKTLEPNKEISYVLQSNLYCVRGQWKEAEMVRKAMVDEGLKKMPGCSWIEVRNKVTAFVAGNHLYPYTDELYKTLYFLEFEMRSPCFSGSEK